MNSAIITIICTIVFDGAFGLKCKNDPECLTLTDMGSGWGGFFNGQDNAPCLAGVVAGDKLGYASDVLHPRCRSRRRLHRLA